MVYRAFFRSVIEECKDMRAVNTEYKVFVLKDWWLNRPS